MMKIDELIKKIKETKCPICVGLDAKYDYLPEGFGDKEEKNILKRAADALLKFNIKLIDSICDICSAVKIQVAYYEMYGVYGMDTFKKSIDYAKSKGMMVIADIKRNDIGSTAGAYANAYLDGSIIDGETVIPFDADFITVNAYLGIDGIKPFIDAAAKTGKGMFILVKTSNPSSGEFQDKKIDDEELYKIVGKHVDKWGSELVGENGYSSLGAVVGATYPMQAGELRKIMPNTFFLIPGYGAQGATADDVTISFDEKGLGGIINSSRAILLAYRKEKYASLEFDKAARQALIDSRDEILESLKKRNINL